MRQSFTKSPDADSRGERESLHSPLLHRERDAARQRAAATRREQWTVLSGTSTIGHGLHVADSLDDRWRLRAGGREQWTVLSRTSTIGRTYFFFYSNNLGFGMGLASLE